MGKLLGGERQDVLATNMAERTLTNLGSGRMKRVGVVIAALVVGGTALALVAIQSPYARLVLLVPLAVGFCQLALIRRRVRLVRQLLVESAQSQPCPSCGRALGIEAVKVADERWQHYVTDLQQANPGIRLRLWRGVHAVCTSCSAGLQFQEASRMFVLTEAER